MSDTDIAHKIAECWREGMGLKETGAALKRLGIWLEREAIRRHFVTLSEGWLS